MSRRYAYVVQQQQQHNNVPFSLISVENGTIGGRGVSVQSLHHHCIHLQKFRSVAAVMVLYTCNGWDKAHMAY